MSQPNELIQSAQRTIRLEIEAIEDLLQRINGDFVRARITLHAEDRVEITHRGHQHTSGGRARSWRLVRELSCRPL
mgnify:CR=1 FL=1